MRDIFLLIKPFFDPVRQRELDGIDGTDNFLYAISPSLYGDLEYLHDRALADCDCDSMDVFAFDGVYTDIVRFESEDFFIIKQRVCILEPYGYIPAGYSIKRTKKTNDLSSDEFLIEYGIGVKGSDGKLRYPIDTRHGGGEYFCPENFHEFSVYRKRVISFHRKLI